MKLEDRVDLLHVDRQLIAIRAEGRAQLTERLAVGEQVLQLESRGAVGVAATSRRLLGVGGGDGDFAELRYRRSERERPSFQLEVGERVALVAFSQRLAGLAAGGPGWRELPLSPGESAEQVLADANLAAVVTGRRAIAFAPGSDFVEIALSPREAIEGSSLRDSSVSLVTPRRILVFRSGARRWVELRRPVNP